MEKEEIKYKTFDLEKALAGEKVITRDGRMVNIVSHRLDGEYCIGGIIQGDDWTNIDLFVRYNKKGQPVINDNLDLFMAPIKRKMHVHIFRSIKPCKSYRSEIVPCEPIFKAEAFRRHDEIFIKTIEDYIEE